MGLLDQFRVCCKSVAPCCPSGDDTSFVPHNARTQSVGVSQLDLSTDPPPTRCSKALNHNLRVTPPRNTDFSAKDAGLHRPAVAPAKNLSLAEKQHPFLRPPSAGRSPLKRAEKKESAAPVPVRSAPNGKTSVAATAEPSNAPVITCAPEQAATPVLLDALQDTREPETVRSLSITPKADVSESSISRTFDQPVESKSEENESQRQLSAGAGNTTSPQSMSPPPPVLNVPEGFFDGLMSGRDPEKILTVFSSALVQLASYFAERVLQRGFQVHASSSADPSTSSKLAFFRMDPTFEVCYVTHPSDNASGPCCDNTGILSPVSFPVRSVRAEAFMRHVTTDSSPETVPGHASRHDARVVLNDGSVHTFAFVDQPIIECPIFVMGLSLLSNKDSSFQNTLTESCRKQMGALDDSSTTSSKGDHHPITLAQATPETISQSNLSSSRRGYLAATSEELEEQQKRALSLQAQRKQQIYKASPLAAALRKAGFSPRPPAPKVSAT